MKDISRISMIVLTVLVASIHLPILYDKLMVVEVERTHLLFSPVLEEFVWREKIQGDPPPEALAKAEDHHAAIAYRDENGAWYTRREFEERLPFIYYKNMELWGMLPLDLGGRTFTRADIKGGRQVMEFKPREIVGKAPLAEVYPLIESSPSTARLVFPDDRFRLASNGLEFINADYNVVDPDLSGRFSDALKQAGFVFPAKFTSGTYSILKPYDDGAFLVDADDHIFHLKRVNGEPEVVAVHVEQEIKPRHIKVFENRRREFRAMVLGEDARLHLMRWDYSLVELPLEGYDPDAMDFKLVVNPLHATAVWSDEVNAHAVAMNREFRPLRRFGMEMSRAAQTPAKVFRSILFPFRTELNTGNGFWSLGLVLGSGWALAMNLGCLLLFISLRYAARGRRPGYGTMGLVAATGLYGLIAGLFLQEE